MKYFYLLPAVLLAAALCSCNKYERETEKAIELFKKGHPESLDRIESLLIERIKQKEFTDDRLVTNDEYLFSNTGSSIKIEYPVARSIKSLGPRSQFVYDDEKKIYAVTDGLKIYVKDEKRNLTRLIECGEKKAKVKAIALFGDLILFYQNKKLYYYDIVTEKRSAFLKEELPPPYDKYYGAKMRRVSNVLVMITGMAGSYFCNIIDLSTKTVLVKNIAASSGRIYLKGSSFYYIAGNTGNWDLVEYRIREKSKNVFFKVNDLVDIEMLLDGYAYENSRGLWIGSFGGPRMLLPFKYNLCGKVNDLVVLKHRAKIYLVKIKELREECENLRAKLPEIFLLK